jgi:hypothetical protein
VIPDDRQYGYVLQVQFQVCETFGAGRLCSDWSSPIPTPDAVVSTRVVPSLLDLTLSFVGGSPLGGQPSPYLTYSCDNFATPGIPLGETGSCENTAQTRGNIWVRVTIPGQPTHADQYKL